MKRIISSFVILTAAVSLVSCGKKQASYSEKAVVPTEIATEPSTEPTTVQLHEKHDYEQGILKGTWSSPYMDLEIVDDTNVSIIWDITDVLFFTNDGGCMIDGETYSPDEVASDGSEIKVLSHENTGEDESVLLCMKRIDETEGEGLDGEYILEECELLSYFAYDETQDIDMPEMRILVSGELCDLKYKDIVNYSQNGDEVTLTGKYIDYAGFEDGAVLSFVMEGDVCTLYYGGVGETLEFTKNSGN